MKQFILFLLGLAFFSCSGISSEEIYSKYGCLNNDNLVTDGQDKFIFINKGNKIKLTWKWENEIFGKGSLYNENIKKEFSCEEYIVTPAK
jgi:hypothetical protein